MARYLDIFRDLKSPDWRKRRAAIRRDSAQIEHLKVAIKDSQPEVRLAAYLHLKAPSEFFDIAMSDAPNVFEYVGERRGEFSEDQIFKIFSSYGQEVQSMFRWHTLRPINYMCEFIISPQFRAHEVDYFDLREAVKRVFERSLL